MPAKAPETTVLFPTPMKTEQDALHKALEIQQTLDTRKLGDPSTRQLVADMFAHIALNAVQHLSQDGTAHATALHSTKDNSVRMIVSDSGEGIAASLANNPNTPKPSTDIEAIVLATKNGISGHNDPDRGRGLHLVMEQAIKPNNYLVIHSRKGILTKLQGGTFQETTAGEYFGTMVVLTVPL